MSCSYDMAMSSIAVASIAVSSIAVSSNDENNSIAMSLKDLDTLDLMKVMKSIVHEVCKKMKSMKLKSKTKKEGSMPKGIVPAQLRRPRAWVDFTLKHAQENGWESFTIFQTKKNKETGKKEVEEIKMEESVFHDGTYIYQNSVNEKNPTGKKMIQKDAMSLSKQRWTAKDSTGTHKSLYEEFLSTYEDEDESAVGSSDDASDADSAVESVASTASTASAIAAVTPTKKNKNNENDSVTSVPKTPEKSIVKEIPSAPVKVVKVKAKEKVKEVNEEVKEEVKEIKEEIKEEVKKEVKEEVKKVKKVKEVKEVKVKEVKVKEVKVKEVKEKTKGKETEKEKEKEKDPETDTNWVSPEDGNVTSWKFKGKLYLRNSYNHMWEDNNDGELGKWSGVYIPTENRIDETAEEPLYENE